MKNLNVSGAHAALFFGTEDISESFNAGTNSMVDSLHVDRFEVGVHLFYDYIAGHVSDDTDYIVFAGECIVVSFIDRKTEEFGIIVFKNLEAYQSNKDHVIKAIQELV